MQGKWKKIQFPLIASLTLGLAPFFPEPHLWGKLKWVFGGAEGMALMDWFDLAMHGTPWVWLVVVVIQTLLSSKDRDVKNT